MPSYMSIHGNNIINETTGATFEFRGENNKYYAILLKCGHCFSQNYFIPILCAVKAKDLDAVKIMAKKISRVKRDQKNFIIDMREISKQEAILIHLSNDYNTYLQTQSRKDSDIEDTLSRRIIEPDCISLVKDIKTSDEYDSKYIVERYCAPNIVGNKLTYPKKINMEKLIKEYLTLNVQQHGCDEHFLTMICVYFQAYGQNNDLNIEYLKESQEIKYHTSDGDVFVQKIPEPILVHMEKPQESLNAHVTQSPYTTENDDETTPAKARPSATEKFYSRLVKTHNITQKKNTSEDGSESEGC